jgi:hypothetical protein
VSPTSPLYPCGLDVQTRTYMHPFSQDTRSRAPVLRSVPPTVFAAVRHARIYSSRTSRPPGTSKPTLNCLFFRYYAKDTSHGISENHPFNCEHKTRSLRWCPSKIAPTTSDGYLDSPTGEPRISVWPLSTTRFVYVAHDGPGWLITLLEVYLFVCVGVHPR